jgi:hypothetical protein
MDLHDPSERFPGCSILAFVLFVFFVVFLALPAQAGRLIAVTAAFTQLIQT